MEGFLVERTQQTPLAGTIDYPGRWVMSVLLYRWRKAAHPSLTAPRQRALVSVPALHKSILLLQSLGPLSAQDLDTAHLLCHVGVGVRRTRRGSTRSWTKPCEQLCCGQVWSEHWIPLAGRPVLLRTSTAAGETEDRDPERQHYWSLSTQFLGQKAQHFPCRPLPHRTLHSRKNRPRVLHTVRAAL